MESEKVFPSVPFPPFLVTNVILKKKETKQTTESTNHHKTIWCTILDVHADIIFI